MVSNLWFRVGVFAFVATSLACGDDGELLCPERAISLGLPARIATKAVDLSTTNDCIAACYSGYAGLARCDYLFLASEKETTCTVKLELSDGTFFSADAEFKRGTVGSCTDIYGKWLTDFGDGGAEGGVTDGGLSDAEGGAAEGGAPDGGAPEGSTDDGAAMPEGGQSVDAGDAGTPVDDGASGSDATDDVSSGAADAGTE
jgi:hypothetical protein